MLKALRNKLRSLTETQLNLLTALLILINIGIVVFWINFWISLPKTTVEIEEKPSAQQEEVPPETIQKMSAPPSGETEEVSEEILEKLSAPKKSK